MKKRPDGHERSPGKGARGDLCPARREGWSPSPRSGQPAGPPPGSRPARASGRHSAGAVLAALLFPGIWMAPAPGLGGPGAWALGPTASETLRTALADPAVQQRLPPDWQVESLSIAAWSVEVRLRSPTRACAVGRLLPREPGSRSGHPVLWVPCSDGAPVPDDPPTPFAEALRDALGPGDFVAIQAPDDSSDPERGGPPLGLLLASAGLQFLVLVALSALALAALGRLPDRSASRQGPPDEPRPPTREPR